MPRKRTATIRSVRPKPRLPQARHLRQILQVAEDLEIPLTVEELLTAVHGAAHAR